MSLPGLPGTSIHLHGQGLKKPLSRGAVSSCLFLLQGIAGNVYPPSGRWLQALVNLTDMNTINKVLSYRDGLIILRDVDHGCESFFWLVPMSAAELEEWWRSMETFEGGSSDLDTFYRILDKPAPVHRRIELPGVLLKADSEEKTALWLRFVMDGQHYKCVICCDCDSYLERPDGVKLYHKGAQGDEAT